MSDNISRQAVLNLLKHDVWNDVIETIEAMPSTDHNGEWLEAPCEDKHDKFVLCSECRTFGGSGELAEVVKNYNFCPHCGADMRGEQNE